MSSQNRRFLTPFPPLSSFLLSRVYLVNRLWAYPPPSPCRDDIVYGRPLTLNIYIFGQQYIHLVLFVCSRGGEVTGEVYWLLRCRNIFLSWCLNFFVFFLLSLILNFLLRIRLEFFEMGLDVVCVSSAKVIVISWCSAPLRTLSEIGE